MSWEEDELRRTAEFVEAVTASTRSRLTLFWFPMAAFGTVTLGAALLAVVGDPSWLGVYWMVIGPVAGFATARHYRQSELEMGLVRPTWPYLLSAAVLAAGAFVMPLLVSPDPAWAISAWTGFGYSLFAWLERSVTVALVAGLFVGVGLIFRTVEVGNETALVSGLSGIVLLVGAAVLSPKQEFA